MKRITLADKLSRYSPAALIGGAALCAYLYFAHGFGIDFNQKFKSREDFLEKFGYSVTGFAAAIAGGVAYGFMQQSKMLKPPLLKNYLKLLSTHSVDAVEALELEKKDDIEGKIRSIEKKRKIFRYEGLLDLEIGSLCIKNGEIERGIDHIKRSFEEISEKDYGGLIEVEKRLAHFFIKRKKERKIKENPKDIESYFNMIAFGILSGNFKESCSYWDRLCEIESGEKKDLNVLYALFLDTLHENRIELKRNKVILPEEIKPVARWRKSINLLFSEKGIEKKFKKIADSRNEVLEYGPSRLIKDTFVFKRGTDNERLRKGFTVNLFLNDINESGELKLSVPLRFLTFSSGNSYDISRRKPMKTLEEAFENASHEEKEAMLKRDLLNQAKIHSAARHKMKRRPFFTINMDATKIPEMIPLDAYSIPDNLERRLIRRLGKSAEGDKFIGDITYGLEKHVNCCPGLIHGDLAISNVLEDGTILDWETASRGNPLIDVVTSLEDPKNGDIDGKELFFKDYIPNFEDPEKEFLDEEGYNKFSAFISACQVGSKINQGDIERAKGFALKVIEKSEPKVKDSFVRYVRSSERKEAKELQKVL